MAVIRNKFAGELCILYADCASKATVAWNRIQCIEVMCVVWAFGVMVLAEVPLGKYSHI